MWYEIIRVQTYPRLQCFNCFIYFTSDVVVILLSDIKTLTLTYTITKIVRLLQILCRRFNLFLIDVKDTDTRMRHREIGIQLDSTVIERERLAGFSLRALFVTHRI